MHFYGPMTTLEALAFLQPHQLLPDDDHFNLQPELMLSYEGFFFQKIL